MAATLVVLSCLAGLVMTIQTRAFSDVLQRDVEMMQQISAQALARGDRSASRMEAELLALTRDYPILAQQGVDALPVAAGLWWSEVDTRLVSGHVLPDGRPLTLVLDTTRIARDYLGMLFSTLEVFGGAMLLSLLILYRIGRQQMHSGVRLIRGMQAVALGRSKIRLPVAEAWPPFTHLFEGFNQMAVGLELNEKENSLLSQTLLRAQEQERRSLAELLQSESERTAGQLRHQADQLLDIAELPRCHSVAGALHRVADDLDARVREWVGELHPMLPASSELKSAVESLAGQWQRKQGIQLSLQMGGRMPDLSEEDKTHLYRLVQEMLANIARQTRTSSVHLRLQGSRRSLRLLVRDNGEGLAAETPSFRWRKIMQRARCLGGELRLLQRPGAGCALYLNLPVSMA